MQLSIIIVNYNVKFFLEQCLASVNKAIGQLKAEVWVVDNASSDNSVEYLQPKFPGVKFISNVKNVGFAKANNQVLYECGGRYVLFVNPDTLIAEDTLIKCIAFMEANTQAGALGIRMIDGKGAFLPESKRSFPSPLTSFYKLVGLSRLFPSSAVFSRYALGYLDEYKNYEVDVLSGAFMLVRKNLLAELKGFDEAFFMYGEDIDLSYRLQKKGYKNFYFSGSTIIHFKGESTRKKSLKYVRMFYEAMSIFVKKHYTGRSAYLNAFLLHFAIWSRAGVSAASQFVLKTGVLLLTKINSFSRRKKKDVKSEMTPGTIIVGTHEEYAEVKTLLAKAGLEKKIIGTVVTDEKKENNLQINIDLNSFLETGKITEIIFCEGTLPYSWIIDKIQNLPKKVSIRFHAKGTESIVGSDSKDTAGEYIFANAEVE